MRWRCTNSTCSTGIWWTTRAGGSKSKNIPKLTQVGAWRDGIGFGLDPNASTAYGPDGRYGGFYTQDDIREVVAYAAARHITIVPEIEMPGHSTAALAAYPQFSCTGGPFNSSG